MSHTVMNSLAKPVTAAELNAKNEWAKRQPGYIERPPAPFANEKRVDGGIAPELGQARLKKLIAWCADHNQDMPPWGPEIEQTPQYQQCFAEELAQAAKNALATATAQLRNHLLQQQLRPDQLEQAINDELDRAMGRINK